MFRIIFHLSPEAGDLSIDRAVESLSRATARVIQKEVARQHSARIGDENHQQIELACLPTRLRFPSLPVLFTSGYVGPEITGQANIRAGSWLRKPHTASDLAWALRRIFSKQDNARVN